MLGVLMNGTQQGESESQPPKHGVPWGVLLGIALFLIALYVVGLSILLQLADDTGTNETIWSRYTYLLAGFEAVVFTAVGWLFGREVNRKQAEQAESATNQAMKKSEQAAAAKSAGEGLRTAVLSLPSSGAGDAFAAGLDPALAALREQAANTRF
jgi:hypothetical protein